MESADSRRARKQAEMTGESVDARLLAHQRRYRIRSRVVKGAPQQHRTFYVQRFEGLVDGRESWRTVARSRDESQARAYLSQAMAQPESEDAVRE